MGSSLQAWTRALERTASIGRRTGFSLPTLIDEVAARYGTAPALLGEDFQLSYAELEERSRRYTRWVVDQDLRAGDVIGVLMPNGADYVACWLGLSRAGAVAALLNTHLTGASLAHAVNTAAPRHLIVATELAAAAMAVRPLLSPTLRYWAHGGDISDVPRIEPAIAQYSADPLGAAECAVPGLREPALLIYTSGTTGLPKAACISHRRLLQWSLWFAGMMNTGPDDRMYDCLPMYHSVGGVVAIGALLVSGGSVLIRRRFSLGRFWDEVVDSRCTLFQYIGELCRYLAVSPPHPREREHHLRLCCGNGLRREVWERFQDRFAIPRILEFYAATEANFSLYNCEGKPGAIGRVPPFLAHRLRIELVRIDLATGEPPRGEDGLCVRAEADEPGESVSEIQDERLNPGSRFEGYTDAAATERKILRNVLSAGDAWYRSGDLMRRDRNGFFYFVDRLGATYRWKGENVATAEIIAALWSCPGVLDGVAYGVEVPGVEGRAGMVAIVPLEDFDLARLHRHFSERLPDYARPVFVRLLSRVEITETFKPKVHAYAAAGFDPRTISDPLYVYDREPNVFVKLDGVVFERIRSGAMRW
ncbi:MAG: long-chain-acyl-CoA synthetase [Steroidobacteraceae bacterium]